MTVLGDSRYKGLQGNYGGSCLGFTDEGFKVARRINPVRDSFGTKVGGGAQVLQARVVRYSGIAHKTAPGAGYFCGRGWRCVLKKAVATFC